MLRLESSNLDSEIGTYSDKGKKSQQEDHVAGAKQLVSGINLLSVNVQDVIIRNHFRQMQNQYCQCADVGSTACVVTAWIVPEDNSLRIVVASLGDSHAHLLLVDKKNKRVKHYEQLTYPHKPNDPAELERINNAGGFVKNGRLNARLAMSRAFGDTQYDSSGISHEPDIDFFNYELIEDYDVYIIVASDGLDLLTNDDYSQVIEDIYDKHQVNSLRYAAAAKALVDLAINECLSKDNCTAALFRVSETPLSVAVFDGHGGDSVADYLEKFFYQEFKKHIQFALLSEAQHSDAYTAETESDNEAPSYPPETSSSEASTTSYGASSPFLFAAAPTQGHDHEYTELLGDCRTSN